MEKLKRILSLFVVSVSKTNQVIAYGVAVILIFFGGAMLYEAVARHFFNSPTTWAFELSKMSFGFYMIWGGAYTMLRKEHINMDIFYGKWSPRAKAIIDSITFLFFSLSLLFLLYLVSSDALNSISFKETSNSTIAQPLYHWRASLVIGILLLFFQGIAEFLKDLWFAINEEDLL